MSIQYDTEEFVTYRVSVDCEHKERCGNEVYGEFKDTKAAALTAACDEGKSVGWAISGNRALCPDCDNAESNQEDPIEDEPNLLDLERDRMVEARRVKR